MKIPDNICKKTHQHKHVFLGGMCSCKDNHDLQRILSLNDNYLISNLKWIAFRILA